VLTVKEWLFLWFQQVIIPDQIIVKTCKGPFSLNHFPGRPHPLSGPWHAITILWFDLVSDLIGHSSTHRNLTAPDSGVVTTEFFGKGCGLQDYVGKMAYSKLPISV